MKLVIVETPAHAKILTSVLGEDWRVEPCSGFVRDLPADQLGVDVKGDFHPTFVIAPGKGNLVRRLMKAVRASEAVYAATPPGRIGEAMAWHVLALSSDAKEKPIYRVSLDALTPDAIRAAFALPRPLDMHWIDAEVTERIVDRLVGHSVSATALKALATKNAVSRTGMRALHLLVNWEKNHAEAVQEVRWAVKARFQVGEETVEADMFHPHGAPIKFTTREKAEQLIGAFTGAHFWIDKAGVRTQDRIAPMPYRTAALLMDAEMRLGLFPERVQELLNTLYDAGWITHPQGNALDGTVEAVQTYIRREFGTDYLAPTPRDASGIVPTDVNRVPEDLPGDGAALYALVWKGFIAAHMSPAQLRESGARILAGKTREQPFPVELRARGWLIAFDGWLRVLPEATPQMGGFLPTLRADDPVECVGISVEESLPPVAKRHTPASLIAAHGTARPTVWAHALGDLLRADLVRINNREIVPTEEGVSLAALIETRFPSVVTEAVDELEFGIECIAAGEKTRIDVLRAFWDRCEGDLRGVAQPEPPHPPPKDVVGEHKPVTLRPVEG